MKAFIRLAACAAVLGCHGLVIASDHADPMSLNTFLPQHAPLANITDLHAFVVDKDGKPLLEADGVHDGDQLIISLCVRRRLLYWQINDPELERGLVGLTFRVHLDLDPDIKHHDPTKLPDGRIYKDELNELDKKIVDARRLRDDLSHRLRAAQELVSADSDEARNLTMAQNALDTALQQRDRLLAMYQLAARMEALYGGTIDAPGMIAEDAVLDFRIKLMRDGNTVAIEVNELNLSGIGGNKNFIDGERFDARSTSPAKSMSGSTWKPGAINVQAGIFDDPFIFPRFFRGNVIGIVTSVPLQTLRRSDGSPASQGTILLWATTHETNGKQSDHVGRSLRTQLPRFGYLNPLHPAAHVATILRRHGNPTLLENSLATFIAPLEAHRFYDAAPDVMVYDLTKPSKFPNGRWLEDDVAKTLSDAGETLLFELSLAESRQFPRATTNDKPFRKTFPYLAEPWSEQEVADHAYSGTSFENGFKVPDAPDGGATALPDFSPDVWKSIWFGLLLAILVTGGLAFVALSETLIRLLVIAAALVCLSLLNPIRAAPLTPMDKGFVQQPYEKLKRVLFGSAVVTSLGLVAVYAAGIRRGQARSSHWSHAALLEDEGETMVDRQYDGSTYREVHDAVFTTPYNSPVPWGAPGTQLPTYHIPIRTLAKGLWLKRTGSPFRDASSRTIASHADLRWGKNHQGVLRLLHPHGVCLAGRWRITRSTPFTGYFATGKECLIIARYSSEERLRSKPRTLSLVGKLFPALDPNTKVTTASFIAQSALGGVRNQSIFDAELRNAPDVFPLASANAFIRLMLSLVAFKGVDSHKTERQLYEIAEAGEDTMRDGWMTKCPRYMRLSLTSSAVSNPTEDFRDDVLAQIYDRGNAVPQRRLVFRIEVSDSGKIHGLINKRLVGARWNEIGEIDFTEAVASHNGDFVIHFHHPKWRDERA